MLNLCYHCYIIHLILLISKPTIRLEANSEKGPRNHFRGEGMLEDVTDASSLDLPLVNMFCPDDIKNSCI